MRRSFRSNSSFNNHFPTEYLNNYSHNPNISLNGQGTLHFEEVRYVVNDVNLLMIVMVDQAIVQAAISLTETFEAWITSVENETQISGQDILQIAFSKMIVLCNALSV